MRISSHQDVKNNSHLSTAQRIRQAVLEPGQALSPQAIAGLQKFYARVLADLDGIRNGQVGKCSSLEPSWLERLFVDQQETAQVARATTPNLLDNAPARSLRQDYRCHFREIRREQARAAHQESPGPLVRKSEDGSQHTCEWRPENPTRVKLTTLYADGGSRTLERFGTTVRKCTGQSGSLQVEQYLLNDRGQPVHEVLVPGSGDPTRLTAANDGSALLERLNEQNQRQQEYLKPEGQLPPGLTSPQLPHPWWRERDPQADWVPTPSAPTAARPTLAGLSANHSERVARAYSDAFQGNLQADMADHPQAAAAVQAFVANASAEKPTPAVQPGSKAQELCARLESLFQKLDKDGDGKVDAEEVKNALRDPAFKGDDAAALAALHGMMQKKGGLTKGLTREKLAQIKSGQAGKELNDRAGGTFAYYQNKLKNQSHKLFEGSPNPFQLEQGGYGTCYFLAALVSKAQMDPASIAKMIKDNGNGTFTVTFPGHKPVTVTAPTDGELLVGASAGSNGTWATLLEKAYAKAKNSEAWISRDDPMNKVEGGATGEGISDLSGRPVDSDDLMLTRKSTTRKKLQKALSAGKMVVASVSKDIISTSPIPSGHAYTVLDYNPKTDIITLRNPWGQGETKGKDGQAKDGNDNGVFEMTLDEFDKTFSIISYEE